MAGCNLQDTEALSSIPIDQFDWLTCSINFLRFPSDGGGVQHWVPQLPLQCSRVLSQSVTETLLTAVFRPIILFATSTRQSPAELTF